MKQYKDLKELLGVSEKEFNKVINNKDNYYYSYPIRKRNGKKRFIDAPTGVLKHWQKILIEKYFYRYGPHPISCGFAKGKNQVTAAEKHVGKKVLVAMDIKNFFNSITINGVERLIMYLQQERSIFLASHPAIEILENIAELVTYHGIVPQGAPTSPVVSNLYMLKADKALSELASVVGAEVTRYADDIVFSGDLSKKDIDNIIFNTKRILGTYDLKLNHRKIHVNRSNKRMQVVGIVVNDKINIKRETWRNFRARLHNLKISQKPINEEEAQILRGKIEWYKTLNQNRGKQFLTEFGQLNFLNTLNTSTPTQI